MDSGDLGYIADGELYVTGRLKDCIIKGGRNIIPQDVEMAAWEAAGVRKGCVAAFGTTDQDSATEKLVVVAETRLGRAEHSRIAADVTAAVASRVGLPPDEVVLVRPATVPKTSSGKIQRSAIRADYERGDVTSATSAPVWMQLARVWIRGTFRSVVAATSVAAGRAGKAIARAMGSLAAVVFGMAARLAPGPSAARIPVKAGARIAGFLAGCRHQGRIPTDRAGVVLVGRASPLDALSVAAMATSAFVFADRTAFQDLTATQAFLLEPLVARANGSKRGARLEEIIRQALAQGLAVVSISQSRLARRRAHPRFRDAPRAASQNSGVFLTPVGLWKGARGTVRAAVRPPVRASRLPESLAGLRAKLRKALETVPGDGEPH